MRVTIENELGRLEMGGGSHPNWNIVSITGLGLGSKEYNTVRYAGSDGQVTLSEAAMPRTITIGGDVRGDLQAELTRAARLMSRPCTLRIQSKNKRRSIEARCTAFTADERNPAYAQFALQFTSDSAYFTDFSPRSAAVLKRTPLLSTPFTLPCMFTERISESEVVNLGDVKTEPKFTITNTANPGAVTLEEDDDYGILIQNQTTGQHLHLLCHTTDGEVIVIDVAGRSVTSSRAGNLIGALSADSFLSDFWLETGANHIVVTNYNTSEQIHVVCEYNNQYVEAVY